VNPSIMAWKPFFAYPNSANPSQFNPIQRRIVGYTQIAGSSFLISDLAGGAIITINAGKQHSS